MSASPLLTATPPDPLDWRRMLLERKYREQYLPDIVLQPFEVDGVLLSPAEALEKCRPDQYHVALTEYARRQGDDALENACSEFPAPIAIPVYRALNSAENELQRLFHFRDTAEAIIVVLLAVVLGECRARGIKLTGVTFANPKGSPENFTAKKLLTDSVAHRLAMLDGLLTGLSSNPTLVCVSRIPIDAVRRLSDLNDIRNDFAHYEAMTELEAAKVCQEMREQIADALLAFEWLAETELVTFGGTVTGKPGVARFEVHSGSTQNKNIKERTLQMAALAKCLGIVTDHLNRPLFQWNGDVFEATPYFHTELNPKGHRRHVWLFKRRVWHSAETEFQVVGEREVRKIIDSAATVESAVLDGLFT
jgi:hypothetical protein